LIEELSVDSVRITLEECGAIPTAGEDALGHFQVVINEIELGDAELGEEDLLRVGDPNPAALDF
jgi:hypothetical protein